MEYRNFMYMRKFYKIIPKEKDNVSLSLTYYLMYVKLVANTKQFLTLYFSENYRKERNLKKTLLKIWNIICLVPPIGGFLGLFVGCLIYSSKTEYMCFYALGYTLIGTFLHWAFLYMPRVKWDYGVKYRRKVNYSEILSKNIKV